MMNKIRKYLYYFGLILGLSFFGWQLISTVKSNKVIHFSIKHPSLLLLAFVFMMITFGIQYFNWKIILAGMGRNISWFDVSKGYSISFVSRYIPGTFWGYVSRSEWMFRNLGVSYLQTGTASIIEIIVTLTSAFFMIGLIGLLSPGLYMFSKAWVSILIPLIIYILLKRLSLIKEYSLFGRKFINPISGIRKNTWLLCNVFAMVQWIFYGLILWFIIVSVTNSPLIYRNAISTIFESVSIFAFAWCFGFLILFIPGGLGVREMTLTLLLVSNFNISLEVSSFISILMRIIVTVAELFWMGWGIAFTTYYGVKKE